MSSCLTSSEASWIGLFSSTNEPCSGRGECIVVSQLNTSLCLCEGWWDGASDIFDLRVTRDPQTGNELSLDCSNSVIAQIVMWSLLLLVVLLHEVTALKAFGHLFRRHGWRPRNRSFFSFPPYQCLLLDAVIACPALFTLTILKITRMGVIGTDPVVTVCLALHWASKPGTSRGPCSRFINFGF